KAWKVILLHFGEFPTTKELLDKERAVWIRFLQAREAGDRLFLGGCSQGESRPEGVESDRRERWAQSGCVKVTAGSSPYAHLLTSSFQHVCCLFFCGWVYLRFSGGKMNMKHESSGAVKIQEENKWVWPRWVKTALGSCEIWSSYGTMKMGREEAQQILMGECSYSAYMGESVESSGVMRKLETKGADERVTKEEWDEFVKTTPLDHERGNGTESGEQEQNQEDSDLHDQDISQEVENNVQSSGEVDEIQSSGEEQVGPASSEEEQVEPPAKLLQQDVDIKETINKEVKTKERWAEWSGIVTGPNGWEDFESLTRPVTCTPTGSPLPLGDSKHSSCLLLFYISHSYALHSKLGLSCTDRLVLQELLQQDVDIKETINKEVNTKERWAEWSWIVTGPNRWEDFESLTRPVTCTPNGSPLPLGDSKHSSCLLLFYISHSYALHSKLGLSCTDRLVLQ
ncbi:hypothetical protein IGI04_007203, partial [Brassica rapa subsp. trilocularis]